MRALRRGAPAAPSDLRPRAVLLASEERVITPGAIDQAARLAQPGGAPVYVFAIARVHGTNLGFPNPGLLPNKQEWEAQRTSVERAVNAHSPQSKPKPRFTNHQICPQQPVGRPYPPN